MSGKARTRPQSREYYFGTYTVEQAPAFIAEMDRKGWDVWSIQYVAPQPGEPSDVFVTFWRFYGES